MSTQPSGQDTPRTAGSTRDPAKGSGGLEYEVRYDARSFTADIHQNPDFRGKGTLVVGPDGQSFRFSGKDRQGLFPKDKVLEFAAADITDVIVQDSSVRFATSKGRAGEKNEPFHFYCRDRLDAEAVAKRLPTTVAAGGERAYLEKLQRLPGAASPLESVTNLIILANVAVFVLVGLMYGADFWTGNAQQPFLEFGASNGAATTAGEWWRLLTSMFMHYGLIHLAMNMWALLQAGNLLERLLGRPIYAVTYLAAGLGGGLASIYWYGDKVWSAGASGAIFGVYGATLGVMLRLQGEVPRSVLRPLLSSTVLFVLYNLMQGLQHSGIDNAAHLGGLLTGLVLGLAVALPLDLEVRTRKLRMHLGVALGVTVLVVVAGVIVTPRFDYRIRDELALDKLAKSMDATGRPIAEAFQAAAKAFDEERVSAEDFRRAAGDYIAFATRSAAEVRALDLMPGSRTVHRREAILDALEKQIAVGERTVKLSREQSALKAWSREYAIALTGFEARATVFKTGNDTGETLIAWADKEIAPFFGQWEEKARKLTLTDDGMRAAREKFLTQMKEQETALRASATAALEQKRTRAWQRMQEQFKAGYAEINGRFMARQLTPTDAIGMLDREIAPYLAQWEKKFSEAPAPSPEVRQAQLTLIREAGEALKKARADFEARGRRNEVAAEINRRITEFNALSQRAGVALANKSWPAMVDPLRDDLMPAYESLRLNVAAVMIEDSEVATIRQKLLDEVDKKRAVLGQMFGLAQASARIVSEMTTLKQRLAELVKQKLPDDVARRVLQTEILPLYDGWLKSLDSLALSEPGLIAEANNFKTKIRDERATQQALATAPAKK